MAGSLILLIKARRMQPSKSRHMPWLKGRVDGVQFDAALFTNLTRDHLDYHGDMRHYFESKARLFLQHSPKTRIINLDSEFGSELAARCGQNVVTVSTKFDRVANGRPYVFARSVVASKSGSNITITSSWGDGKLALNLPGEFNVANAAIVLAYLLTAGVSFEQACDVLQLVKAPPGRMQKVESHSTSIYIDYAHTPNAIESALRALRPHCRGTLYCVFGCGGDRDTGKRPLMGRLAERLADKVVVTTDNPRSESPHKIIDEILSGFRVAEKATVIEDRSAAIAWAVEKAGPADVVLIAGKGHEDYQEVGKLRHAFSDLALATAAANAKESERDRHSLRGSSSPCAVFCTATTGDFDGVSTDTRSIRNGELFFALQGPNFDGHDYVGKAKASGAAGVVVTRLQNDDIPQIQVDDAKLALGRLGAAWRNSKNVQRCGHYRK